jgi:alkaline phosphatase
VLLGAGVGTGTIHGVMDNTQVFDLMRDAL